MKKSIPTILIVLMLMATGYSKKNPAPKVDLHTAAVIGDVDAVKQHINSGSDLNVKEPTRGSTPLITAAVFGQTAVAVALINGGADVNVQNNEGSTALITAAFFCRPEIVKALLDKGADKSLKNKAGRTALDAVSKPFEEVKDIYKSLGAALEPLGLKLDYDYIKETRPKIAEMLK